ncbi:MAG: FMN-binding protein [Chloroflexota bacterium]|jgi:uncharacterized protein with FMN-binding domain
MTTEPREPSRLPIRGTIAAAGTVGALTLLLSFRGGPLAPTEPALAAAEEPAATDQLLATPATETSAPEAVAEPVAITGELISTRWGDVQVQVTLEGSDILDVVALALPDGDHHSADISDYVEPILREEAIGADSADVSVISGATYTSRAYAASLQSALDTALTAGEESPPAVEVEEPADDTAAEDDLATEDDPAAQQAAIDEPAAAGAVTVTGDAFAIRWGDVQVAVTVDGGDIIDVETVAMPMGDARSERINSRAEPILREEAIAIDGADVSVISGATYTSRAYAASLQSALDQLGL